MADKKCALCNKSHSKDSYLSFGTGCLDNIYKITNTSKIPGKFLKERYICTRISWRCGKWFLPFSKKRELTQKYIAIKYIENFNLPNLETLTNQLQSEIDNIRNLTTSTVDFTLNDVYKINKTVQKFNDLIQAAGEVDFNLISENELTKTLDKFLFIFKLLEPLNSLTSIVFAAMQYRFWNVIITGGVFKNYILSAKFLFHSISSPFMEPSDIKIGNDEARQYGLQTNIEIQKLVIVFIKNKNATEDLELLKGAYSGTITHRFDKGDLAYSIGTATLHIRASPNKDSTWMAKISITDKYDYTEFRKYRGIELGSILNDFAHVSYQLGVIKDFKVEINFVIDNLKVN